ncbi:MAG: SAM-dependent methyltransferase [Firmicutes bacterium]|nr:SAM-dependent methyltransferase [Bacillota bacterium]
MGARKYDGRLGIRTVGLRERDGHSHYNRYEATPYEALDRLFQVYRFNNAERVVDFGCGRGRVAFYIHYHFCVPVVGIEEHDKTYEEALNNKASYRHRTRHIKAPIRLKYGLAEHYEVKPIDNCFYFFNPFSSKVFKKVVHNILQSIERDSRSADMILYYPTKEYKRVLKYKTPFRLLNKVRLKGASDPHEKFLIYRLSK